MAPSNEKNGRKLKSYDLHLKVKTVSFAQRNSGLAAARKFSVDVNRIRKWKEQKDQLLNLLKENTISKDSRPNQEPRRRLKGGGRKTFYVPVEKKLANWVLEQRAANLPPPDYMIRTKAQELFKDFGRVTNFATANDWLHKFMKRNGLLLENDLHNIQNPALKGESGLFAISEEPFSPTTLIIANQRDDLGFETGTFSPAPMTARTFDQESHISETQLNGPRISNPSIPFSPQIDQVFGTFECKLDEYPSFEEPTIIHESVAVVSKVRRMRLCRICKAGFFSGEALATHLYTHIDMV